MAKGERLAEAYHSIRDKRARVNDARLSGDEEAIDLAQFKLTQATVLADRLFNS